jgi:hypothetical protein
MDFEISRGRKVEAEIVGLLTEDGIPVISFDEAEGADELVERVDFEFTIEGSAGAEHRSIHGPFETEAAAEQAIEDFVEAELSP